MTLERLTTISNAGISSNLSITGIITATSFVGDGGGMGISVGGAGGNGGSGIVIIAYPS